MYKARFDKNARDKDVARRQEHPSLAPKFILRSLKGELTVAAGIKTLKKR